MSNPYDPYSSGQQPQQPVDAAAPTQFVPVQQPPQQPAYGAPQEATQPYGVPQPQPSAFGQAPQQPGQPAFGQQPPAFGQPPQQPGQPAFGQQPPAFGQQPGFGQAPQGAYGYPTPVSQVKANRTGGAKIAAAIFGSILGRILVGVVLVGGIALYHFATSNPAHRDSNGQVNKAGTLSVQDLQVGDCFNLPSSESDIQSVTAIPCTEPHDSQIYAEPKITEGSYPGTDTLKSEGQNACNSTDSLAGVSSSVPTDAGVEIFFPEDSETFDAGTNYFSCALTSSSKNLTQSYVTTS